MTRNGQRWAVGLVRVSEWASQEQRTQDRLAMAVRAGQANLVLLDVVVFDANPIHDDIAADRLRALIGAALRHRGRVVLLTEAAIDPTQWDRSWTAERVVVVPADAPALHGGRRVPPRQRSERT